MAGRKGDKGDSVGVTVRSEGSTWTHFSVGYIHTSTVLIRSVTVPTSFSQGPPGPPGPPGAPGAPGRMSRLSGVSFFFFFRDKRVHKAKRKL